ncbi:MAG TPA: hypothetical protein VMS49_07585 [Lysobacter sp.]|jgi:hypothetical protein|nr:hypothetical protein [Lysobacter sp.]
MQQTVPGASQGELDPALEAELEALDREMPRMQATSPSIFALATQWAERHDAILQRTPPAMREAMTARLHRMGIRWGVVNGARMTAQFPALGLPPKRIVLPDDEAA